MEEGVTPFAYERLYHAFASAACNGNGAMQLLDIGRMRLDHKGTDHTGIGQLSQKDTTRRSVPSNCSFNTSSSICTTTTTQLCITNSGAPLC